MKNRHWWSPQGEDAHRDEQRLDRCDDVASLLTALFDGEANEDEARRARLHLLACQRCAEVFANWSQTRQILRSEATPPPPPTLLWRVIVACRVAGYTRKPTAKETAKAAPAPRGDALSPVPPTFLKDSILASTVGSKPSRPVAVTPLWRRNTAAWPALAVPAFALWFMMLAGGQSSMNLANRPVSEDTAPIQMVARPLGNKPAMAKLKQVFALPSHAESVRKTAIPATPKAAPEAVEVAVPKIRSVALTSPRQTPVEREVHEAHRERSVRREAVEVIKERPAPAPMSQPTVVLASMETPSAPVARPILMSTGVTRPIIKRASMADNDTPTPRPRRASFNPLTKSTIARLAKAAGTMRASAPVEPVTTPLVLASTGDPDHNLDEVQSTVEDLRALFATDPDSEGDEL